MAKHKYNRILLSLFLFISVFPAGGFSQMFFPVESNSDCNGAIELEDTVFGPTVPPEGHGQQLEISKNPNKDLYSFEKEHNTLWYKFKALYSTELTFDIIPVDTMDDFDFLLFKHTGAKDFCDQIKTRKILPARTNMAKNDLGNKGNTGLSYDAKDEYVRAGQGEPYSKSIYVKEGDVYYLVVDNYSKNGKGHKLSFHYKGYPRKEEKIVLNIKISDIKTRKKIKGDAEVLEINSNEKNKDSPGSSGATVLFSLKNAVQYNVELEEYRVYDINCNAKGYFFYSKQVKTKKKPQVINLKVKLTKVKIGEKLTLQNINFYGDSAAFLSSSKPSLENLLSFMKHNKEIKIEIQGHVNAPKSSNTKEIKQLSQDRAKAVYDYLADHNIVEERLKYKGYGNKEMIFPKPANAKQNEANRRVDILIIDL